MILNIGRKPANKAKPNRQMIWDVIRELKTFNTRDIESRTKINQDTVFSYLCALVKAGFLTKEVKKMPECGNLRLCEYTLIKDNGLIYPQVNRQGQDIEDSVQTQVWKCLRIHKSLTIQDIVVMLSGLGFKLAPSSLSSYLHALKSAGYLSKKKGEKIYKLNLHMNTGAKAPQIQKTKQVYDPNLKKVVWSSKAGGEDE